MTEKGVNRNSTVELRQVCKENLQAVLDLRVTEAQQRFVATRDAAGWNMADEIPYWLVCLTVAAYGAVGLRAVLKSKQNRR